MPPKNPRDQAQHAHGSHAFVELPKSGILTVTENTASCLLQLPSAVSSLLRYHNISETFLEMWIRRSRGVVLTIAINKVKICYPKEDVDTELVNRWCQFKKSSRLKIKETQLESTQLLGFVFAEL